MKNPLALLLLIVGAAFATPTYYSGTGDKAVQVLNTDYFALLAVDVLLQPLDTAYSRPFDLLKVPVNYRDTGVGDANLVYDQTMGTVLISCYDVSDSAAVTDSTDISFVTQLSQYAGDNSNPNGTGELGGKSDTWASGGATSVNAASDAQAVNENTINQAFTTPLDRYVRFKIYNNNTTIKDRSRCRLYWTRKPIRR